MNSSSQEKAINLSGPRSNTLTERTQQIGRRIRTLRRERGLTQEALGGSDFTKGYISALERGAVRPSLKALDFLARRLDVSFSDLLAAEQQTERNVEIAALEEKLHYQLNDARMLIRTDQVDEAFQLLQETEQSVTTYKEDLSPQVLYRIPFLRGLAYLHLSEPVPAQPHLEEALNLAEADPEAVCAVRNLLGVAYYELEQPQLALVQHLQCLNAVETGLVRDLNLRLGVYRNLGNDYWALNQPSQAVGIYEKALTLLEDLNDLQRQAGAYWGLAMAYKAANERAKAKLYGMRALAIYEAADDRATAATIRMNLAELMIIEGRYKEAEDLLAGAQEFLVGTGDQVLLSNLYYDYADLARRRGDLQRAREIIDQSLKLIEAAVRQLNNGSLNEAATPEMPGEPEQVLQHIRENKSSGKPWAQTMRTYAEALHINALIEEDSREFDAADELFIRALAWAERTGFEEMIHTLNFSYGGALERRGAYEQAVKYLRAAAQAKVRTSPRRLGN